MKVLLLHLPKRKLSVSSKDDLVQMHTALKNQDIIIAFVCKAFCKHFYFV